MSLFAVVLKSIGGIVTKGFQKFSKNCQVFSFIFQDLWRIFCQIPPLPDHFWQKTAGL
jgi:hypothetical protein